MIMIHRVIIPPLLALVAGTGCAVAPWRETTMTRPELIRRVLPSVVELLYERGHAPVRYASGVVVGTTAGPRSFVLTSGHAVVGRAIEKAELLVRYRDAGDLEHRAPASVLGVDEARDLALVLVDGVTLSPARLGRAGAARLGDDVVVIGAPFGRGLSVSRGIVSQLTVRRGDGRVDPEPLMKIDAPVGYGSSGGGVFETTAGRLVGVVEGYRTAEVSLKLAGDAYSFQVPMPGETFVVPAVEIRRFLAAQGLPGLPGD